MAFACGPMESWIPATANEWYEWLVREEEKTLAVYREKPTLLIADYHRERAIARDYEGREILELLQNANDQAMELEQRGRVLVELTTESLIVANTGSAFSVGGVASLQTSHLSPKRRKSRKFIGNKGLGFRSVLNLSRTPIILSGALSLAYCMGYLNSRQEELTQSNPEIALLVREEQQGGNALILPFLPFPLYSVDGDLSPRLADAAAKRVFDRCEELLIEGYDTVIGMPFDAVSEYEATSDQLDEIRPEILLFAENLGELCFRRDQKNPVLWRVVNTDGVAEVLANDQQVGKWNLHRTAGKLPASAIESDQDDAIDYEIVVAVPEKRINSSAPLFCHFPTNIHFPLPLVCHATLELEQNRKHLQQGRKSNRYILGKLADYLAEIAEVTAERASDDAWAGCSLLIPLTDYPIELSREEFHKKLIESAKARAIVPTMSGKPTKPQTAFIIADANESWLPKEGFPEVVPIRFKSDVSFLESLGVRHLKPGEIKNRVITRSELTVDQRVALIVGLSRQEILREAHTSALFLDSAGDSLGDGMRVFLAPSSGEVARLPEWADLRFLNENMRLKLSQRLEARERVELQQKLSSFGLRDYSLANLIQALVAETNRAEKDNPEKQQIYQKDLLHTVFELYLAEEQQTKRPEYPERSALQLPNQENGVSPANKLYLGSGFGKRGEIVQALYGPWAADKLIDLSRLPKLTDDEGKLSDFLQWVGIAQWPRLTIEEHPDRKYLQYMVQVIKYPAKFEEKLVTSANCVLSASVTGVQSIDGLDEILMKAESAAITAWLANDDRTLSWVRQDPEHAGLRACPDGVYRARAYRGPVPSYVRWRLETTPWLQSGEGNLLRAKDCVLGERVVEELFPRPVIPDQSGLERYGIEKRDVLEGWRRAGVLTSLAYLERDEIYAKLLELPKRSPDGKLARPLYHWLLDAADITIGGEGSNYREFLNRGKMWGRQGKNEDYFPISELHHADIEGLPNVILQKLKIVDLRKRVGAEKVERVFGVKPIDRVGIKRRLVAKEMAVKSTDADMDFQEAKPYLHKLRASQTSQLTQLQTLKDLRLEVCSTLRACLTFEGTLFEYDIPVWGWLIEEKVLYIRSDPAKPMTLAESLLSDAVGEALASVFRIADGGEFARILLCKEDDRPILLSRLRGESALQDMESIRKEYAAFKSTQSSVVGFSVTAPSKQISLRMEESDPVSLESTGATAPPDVTQIEPNGPLLIVNEPHVPAPALRPRKLQIKKMASHEARSKPKGRVTDGDFCERKAMEYEEADDPPRWPLAVGQVMGAEGPGCDVLSFATQKDRDEFLQGPVHDLSKVVRYIEVKGRSSAVATIELKGNELSAAERHGERYFLYRLFETDDGTYELSLLQDPLQNKEALQPAVHVDMQRALATQRFALIGGLKKDSIVDSSATEEVPSITP